MLVEPIRDPDYLNYLLKDGSRPLSEGFLDFNTADWRLLVDGDGNFVVQHYNGASWDNLFKFVA